MDPERLHELTDLLKPDQVSTKESDLANHAHDESYYPGHLPDVVIWPESTADVSATMRWAGQHHMPVTAWGGGSSLEGNSTPVQGGISLDMTRMNRILDINLDDFQVRVQPGIIGDALNAALKRHGVWFPAVPGSSDIATIGGMIANNAGGMYAVKYGVVGDYVLTLEVVLANGDVLQLGSRSIKTVSGYDLRSLMIGSEGTLGIITEAVLRLRGLPECKLVVLAPFHQIQAAVDAALDIWAMGFEPAALELMDAPFVALANQAKAINWPETPTLLIEMHGFCDSLNSEIPQLEALCTEHGCLGFETATSPHDQNRLWAGRRGVRLAIPGILPQTGILSGDIGVPLSQIPGLMAKAQALGWEHNIRTVAFGHAGDGNFHMWALYDLNDDEAKQRAIRVNEGLVGYAVQVGGTTTAEHGIGLGKQKFLPHEHPSSLALMRAVKHLFDPQGILNPGKIFIDD